MRNDPYPSTFATTAAMTAILLVWGLLRLVVFHESVFPLTFVVPLLLCVWTRRVWQLWFMTAVFAGIAVVKFRWATPTWLVSSEEQWLLLGVTEFNVLAGAVVIRAIMAFRDRLERSNMTISAQNASLEAQAAELTTQNEEIKAQSEELAQQNEEIESQAEELERQNQELQESNERLAHREELLQSVVQCTRSSGRTIEMLQQMCRQALPLLSSPAEALAVLELDGQNLRLLASAMTAGNLPLPAEWPVRNSLARVALEQGKTAYVDDLRERDDLAAPFAPELAVRSLLATPIHVTGKPDGVLVACSRNPSHWTQEQFHIIEWLSAQCGLLLEGLHWQEELEERAREVEAAGRAKDQFLAALSHELRTPLTPVLAAAGALETDSRLPDDVRTDLGMIRRNVAIQSRLIDDLLDLTRIGRGKMDLDLRVLDIAAALRESAGIISVDLDAKDQTLAMQLDLPPDCAVVGDGARLRQVFWNVLRNAVKFSPNNSRIEVTARLAGESPPRVVIEVSDNGVGIDPPKLEGIFEPFEQAADSRRRSQDEGLGLGLSIARAIVTLHGGKIFARSDGIGHGATFVVELPLSAQPLPAARPPAAADAARRDRSGPLRILLVEDHRDTGVLIARLLKNAGHDVQHADSAAGAMRLFHDHPFDLVISDLGLPDGDGLELMRHLRASRPEIAGICLSGYGMDGDVDASKAAGFHEHLTKPIDFHRLSAAIDRVTSVRAESAAS